MSNSLIRALTSSAKLDQQSLPSWPFLLFVDNPICVIRGKAYQEKKAAVGNRNKSNKKKKKTEIEKERLQVIKFIAREKSRQSYSEYTFLVSLTPEI
jgi:hypothetical protein